MPTDPGKLCDSSLYRLRAGSNGPARSGARSCSSGFGTQSTTPSENYQRTYTARRDDSALTTMLSPSWGPVSGTSCVISAGST